MKISWTNIFVFVFGPEKNIRSSLAVILDLLIFWPYKIKDFVKNIKERIILQTQWILIIDWFRGLLLDPLICLTNISRCIFQRWNIARAPRAYSRKKFGRLRKNLWKSPWIFCFNWRNVEKIFQMINNVDNFVEETLIIPQCGKQLGIFSTIR